MPHTTFPTLKPGVNFLNLESDIYVGLAHRGISIGSSLKSLAKLPTCFMRWVSRAFQYLSKFSGAKWIERW